MTNSLFRRAVQGNEYFRTSGVSARGGRENGKEVQLFELLELWNVGRPDRGASHAIIHHHNGAATGGRGGGVLTGGKLEQLEIK